MKKLLIGLFIGLIFFTCCIIYTMPRMGLEWENDHDISVRVRETGHLYQLSARYNRENTGRIQRYIDAQLNTHDLFKNSRMDATVTLDDKTNFYVKTSPGRLLIKFDKNANEPASYDRIKDLGEKIKQKLAGNE